MSDRNIKRILFINPFGIGDVLFTTPLLAQIKEDLKPESIGYLANERCASFLNNDPRIDRVFVYERDAFVKTYQQSKTNFIHRWKELIDAIKNQQYDVVFDLSMTSHLGFLISLTNIPQRIGYDYKGRGKWLTDKKSLLGFQDQHVVEYYGELLGQIDLDFRHLPMQMFCTSEDENWVAQLESKDNFKHLWRCVAVIPGGGASWGRESSKKRWSAPHFADLADKLIENLKVPIILLGDQSEKFLCDEVLGLMKHPAFNLSGKTTLGQFSALVRQCAFVIANDGGPLHVSVASGAKTVSLFGPVDPKVYGPYPAEQHLIIQKQLPCQPCYRNFRMSDCQHISCLTQLSVDEVYRKVKKYYECSIR